MSGTLLSLLEMTTFDFSDLAANGSIEQLVVPNIDVSNWPRGELLLRVHSKDIDAGTFGVELRRALPSPQDPSRLFEQEGNSAAGIIVTANLVAAPGLAIEGISTPLGSFMNLYARGEQTISPGSIVVTVSVELALKR